MKMIDLFAGGAGGWDYAARALGWSEPDGAENNDDAVATRDAAGFATPYRDVRRIVTVDDYEVVAGSPPCTRFSKAGNSPAHQHLDAVRHAIRIGASCEWLEGRIGDPVAALVLEPLRLIERSRPRFVALEQTPTVLPVWEEYAQRMRWIGYSVATGIISADQFGVPQTRRRAVLVARRDGGQAFLPRPTRAYPVPMSAVIDRDPQVWWQRSNYSAPAAPGKRTAAERGRSIRRLWQPSLTITRKVWGWQNEAGAIEPVSVRDMTVLQGFPEQHPWQGGTTSARLQVGNAIPWQMAYALLRAACDSNTAASSVVPLPLWAEPQGVAGQQLLPTL